MHTSDTPWRDAGLMFGRMFEDWSVEARLFPPGGRVFCIASAGCTAIALAARGHDVTAVDGSVNVVEAGAAEYLEACPAQSFDAFTLSNILDTADSNDAGRLGAAIQRAARPGAVAILRSFAEPATRDEDGWARQDRALLWGSIKVTTT
jgi:S-adenosylmethionine:diacylglycerol 3-amino-3-carboxypropyl transferase